LERDPLGELSRIYETLDLTGYQTAESKFRAYVGSLGRYRKNQLNLTPEDRARIEQRWAFAFDRLGYPILTDADCDPRERGSGLASGFGSEKHLADVGARMDEAVSLGRSLESERPRDDRTQSSGLELADQNIHGGRN
jgi:hypothetical protein